MTLQRTTGVLLISCSGSVLSCGTIGMVNGAAYVKEVPLQEL